MRRVAAVTVAAVTVTMLLLGLAACGHPRLPDGPAPEYEAPRTWTDAGVPVPTTSASARPAS